MMCDAPTRAAVLECRCTANRDQDMCPSRTQCPMVVPVTLREEARRNGCLILLGFWNKLLFLNGLFLPCCSPQILTFLPRITTSITGGGELHQHCFPPSLPHRELLCEEHLFLTHGVLEAVRPKNSQLPGEQKSFFLRLQNCSSPNYFPKLALSYSGGWLCRY